MTKKQKNKSLISKNIRNRMVNRRYRSTIKTLLKFFKNLWCRYTAENVPSLKNYFKISLAEIAGKLNSFTDKAVKKNVIHQNKANRIKSRISKIIFSIKN